MSTLFDEEKQNKRIDELQKEEEEDLIILLSEKKYGIPSVNLKTMLTENEALRSLPEEKARELEMAPFRLLGKQLHVAIRAPDRDDVKEVLKSFRKKGFVVFPYMASRESLNRVWDRYKEISFAENTQSGGVSLSVDAIKTIKDTVHSIEDIRQILTKKQEEKKERNTTELLEIIIGSAIAIGASDIHIEPEKEEIHVRFRLDGVLQNIFIFSFEKYKLLTSRIKLLSGLKLTTTDSEQDGRFSIFFDKEETNIRTSVVPGAYGEGIVLRILDPKAIKVSFENLGMEKNLFALLDKEISKPNGLLLITGPTGSGKTTTLYAFLRKLFSPENKIITIEDPVEYHLDGITQTQVEDEKGYTFLEGLRGALRQDPDIIMVGEIRDQETGKIAINAALTGHLVLSTLHTNNAAGVIPRLIDLGINPKIMTSALTISLAQRLVRKLCEFCKTKDTPTDEEKNIIENTIKKAESLGKDLSGYETSLTDISVHRSNGCLKCFNTGYKGRIGIFEAIKTNEAIEKIVTENPSEREIKKIAQEQKMITMQEDGVMKVLSGITTLEEVRRVVDLEE